MKCEGRLTERPRGIGRAAAGSAALAPRLEPQEDVEPVAVASPSASGTHRIPYQTSLFSHRESSRVVPIRPPDPPRRPRPARSPQTSPQPRYQQQDLIFQPPPMSAAPRGPQEGVLCCGAPVAGLVHRALATAVDLALVIIGAGILISIYHLGGGTLPPGKAMLMFNGGVAVLVWLLYESLWAIAGGDTPGTEWTGLRLTCFDDGRPTVNQRVTRLAVTGVGMLAAGLGILWALFDEEGLTWHDHVSNTFLTTRC